MLIRERYLRPFVVLALLIVLGNTESFGQTGCNRVSAYDSLFLSPNGFPTSVCSGDTISIGMAAVAYYFHVIKGPTGIVQAKKGGEGNGGAISFESSASSRNGGVYSANVYKEGCPTLNSNTVVINYKGPKEFNFSGGGLYCPGSSGKILRIDSSELNTSYQLYKKGQTSSDPSQAVGSAFNGTGSAINFSPVTNTGTYFVRATNSVCSINFGNQIIYNSIEGVTINSLTNGSVSFSWLPLQGSLGYRYIVSQSSTVPTTGYTTTTGTNGSAQSLNSSSNYFIYISSQCSSGIYGEWKSYSFSTEAGCSSIPAIGTCTTVTSNFAPGYGLWDFAGIVPDNSLGYPTPGKEVLYSFTPSVSGYYYLQVTNATKGDAIDYLFKTAASGCTNFGYTAIGRFDSIGGINIGMLQAGIQYYILADREKINDSTTQSFKICKADTPDCTGAVSITACANTTANIAAGFGAWDLTASIGSRVSPGKELFYTFTPSSSGSYYLEVLTGNSKANYFIKQSSAGCTNTGWTNIGIINKGDAASLGSLVSGTPYYILLDNITDTAITLSFRVCKVDIPVCSSGTVITVCSNVIADIPAGYGGWDFNGTFPNNSCGKSTPGKELIYSFTPSATGVYYLELVSGNSNYVDYLYKPATGGCSNSGWTGIGRMNNNDIGTGRQLMIGQLTAGVTYYLLLDNESIAAPGTQVFKVCKAAVPDCAAAPVINLCTEVTYTALGGVGAWDFSGTYPDNSVGNSTPGKEAIYTFTPTQTGFYYIDLISGTGNYAGYIDFLYKTAASGCTNTGWKGITRNTINSFEGHRMIGRLLAGVQYFLLIDNENTGFIGSFKFKVCKTTELTDCSNATAISACTPVSAVIDAGKGNWDFTVNGNISLGKEVKYRFTPTVSGDYTLTLTNGSGQFVDYLYKPDSTGCNDAGWTIIGSYYGSSWGQSNTMGYLQAGIPYIIVADNEDSSAQNTQTFQVCRVAPVNPPDCSAAANISLCQSVSLSINSGYGVWNFSGAGVGNETIYKFTPSVSGNYYIESSAVSGSVGFYYKAVSLGCSESNWQFIGDYSSDLSKSFGQLQAGVTYYILADNNNYYSSSLNFKVCYIDIPTCSSPVSISECTTVTASIPSGYGSWDFSGKYPDNSAGKPTPGKELFYVFTPTTTGDYYMELDSYINIDFLYKPVNSGCNSSGWKGIATGNSIGSKYIGQLTAGTAYYILADNETTGALSKNFKICKAGNPPSCLNTPVIANCTTVQADFPAGYGGWDLGVTSNTGLPPSTIPGKELLFRFTPQYSGEYKIETISSSGYSYIDYFYKINTGQCSTTGWLPIGRFNAYQNATLQLQGGLEYIFLLDNESINSVSQTFMVCKTIPPDCSAAEPLTSCTSVNGYIPWGEGNWKFSGIVPFTQTTYSTRGNNKIYSFTPDASGYYSLEIFDNYPYYDTTDYFFKSSLSGCNDTGWTFLQRINENNTAGMKSLGYLQAGTMYYLMIVSENIGNPGYHFQICNSIEPSINAVETINECIPVTANIASGSGIWDFSGDFPYNSVNKATPGIEKVYKFTPATSGFYSIEVTTGDYNSFNYLFKPVSGGFNGTGWTGIGHALNNEFMAIGELQAGVPYYILLDRESWAYPSSQTFKVCKSVSPDCSSAPALSLCTPVTATYSRGFGAWDFSKKFPNNSAGYPTPGKELIYSFTPAVTGGYFLEVTSAPSGMYVDYLIKKAAANCTDTGWTRISEFKEQGGKNIGQLEAGVKYYILLDHEDPNYPYSAQQVFQICKADPPDCTTAPAVSLCSTVSFTIPNGIGGWDFAGTYPTNSLGYATPGKEVVYKFTPASSGYYSIEITSASGDFVDYLFKPSSSGCSGSGWKGISRFNGTGGKNFGPLQAGIEYFIVADREKSNTSPVSQSFRICKSVVPDCSSPTTINLATPITGNFQNGIGGWDFEGIFPSNSSGKATPGIEKFYSFTPPASGYYYLKLLSGDSVSFLYKSITGGCTNTGWTGIGSYYGVQEKVFGPLQLGTTYYVVADNENINLNDFQFVITGERVICPGSFTQFSIDEQQNTSGVNPFFYYWQVDQGNGFVNISDNAYYSGTKSTTLTIYNAPSSLYGFKYRGVAERTGFAATIKYGDTRTLKFSNTWIGSQSSSWTNTANWSCGVIPDEFTDVVIPTGTAYSPNVNSNAVCRSINLKNGATIRIGSGYILDIKGK